MLWTFRQSLNTLIPSLGFNTTVSVVSDNILSILKSEDQVSLRHTAMAETLPHIRITDAQLGASRPLSASPINTNDFTDALEYQSPPSRQTTRDSLNSPSRQAARSSHSPTKGGSSERDLKKLNALERPLTSSSIDPVSQEIYDRTGAVPGLISPPRGYRQSESLPYTLNGRISDIADAKPSIDVARFDPAKSLSRDRKKGVAFFARIIGNKKREEQDASVLDTAELGEERPEGADIELFYQSFDNMGYAPKHRPPPPYVKMRSKYKREREFNRVFLAQRLRDYSTSFHADQASIASFQASRKGHNSGSKAIWTVEVSKDGKHLATAGQDHLVRIWSILSSHQDRTQFSIDEDGQISESQPHLSAPVFREQPMRTFTGHTGDVLSLSWSKNNFLLSSSTDKTVRLWHVSRNECLCAFKHGDFVTSVAFHPKDDRFFLAGSLDSKLRLWSIPDKSVAYSNQAPDMITSVAFTPDGKQAMAGTLGGFCLFYETEGLRYQTQLHVKSRTGKNAKGSKITGIKAMHIPPVGKSYSSSSLNSLLDVKILITSNDSRLRLYNLRDKALERKFKGHENLSSQIHARFSDDGRYIVSGSEDKKVYIWSTTTSDDVEANNSRKDHWPVEIFEANNSDTTCAIFLPVRSRQHLSASEDPIYDICNPPPVTLVSRSEAADVSFKSVRHSVSIVSPGAEDSAPIVRPSLDSTRRASETSNAGYLNRTAHNNGNILIAASATGDISVFRQDCGWQKRVSSNADPSAFTYASDTPPFKRMGSNIVHRSSMSLARSSHGSLSRQNSSTSNRSGVRQTSYGTVHGPAPGALGRERVQSWRQSLSGASIHSTDREKSSPSISVASSSAGSPALPQMRAGNRSTSPRKSLSGFAKRASAVIPRSSLPGERSPTRPGISPLVNGAVDRGQSNCSSPHEENHSAGDGLLARPSDLHRGESYWREDAWVDGAKEQLVAPSRSFEGSSSSTSRAISRSPDRRAQLATVRSADASRNGSRRGSKLLDASGLPELQKKLTTFSALSDNEE